MNHRIIAVLLAATVILNVRLCMARIEINEALNVATRATAII
jgi:hypothetical protein